ncbi:MAG: flavodoxin-dependent (E)-4-hydroxy-3-methylbut-2-enyl-diphosphate synthase [Oscillospiraceae bacterium]|nr:flavodoxin-dependent (E)-4-hydroxy-3-methylbut-2-enyl-diphosphate synthase [Oscillospiraceae bacterium]
MSNTKEIKIGNKRIGAGNKILVQSMLNVISTDISGNVEQAKRLEAAGCDIIRVSVPDIQAVRLVDAIKNETNIPLVADIHFDYKIALECAAAGVDKIRINPGNIGSSDRVKAVADACKQKNIPIRIGVNSGSLDKEILKKHGAVTAAALCESALTQAKMLEEFDFDDIVISIKSSDVRKTIDAYRMVSSQCNYPLHLGITEAGSAHMGLIKSAIGIGSLLCDGIGDTIRVSLTDAPEKEVDAGRDILRAIGLEKGVQLVSCPTCGRTKIDLIKIAAEVEAALKDVKKDTKVAVMGCVVNGPGEASDADIGIAGGDKCAVLFKKGEIICKIPENEIVERLLSEIDKM